MALRVRHDVLLTVLLFGLAVAAQSFQWLAPLEAQVQLACQWLRPAPDSFSSYPAPAVAAAAATLLLMLAMIALALLVERAAWRRAGAVLALAGFAAILAWSYVRFGLVLPLSPALAAGLLSFAAIEDRAWRKRRERRRRIVRLLAPHLPAGRIDEVGRKEWRADLGCESREMTVLFCGPRDFASLSEGLAPRDLATLVPTFLGPMTRLVHAHRGTLDRYQGATLVAFWGAPTADPQHAENAVRAALAMARGVGELSDGCIARGWPPLKIGIGIHTGVMSVGDLGSDFRPAYAAMGQAVDLGARLEILAKRHGVAIVISQSTLTQVPGLIAREVDLVRLRGKMQPLSLFEPLGFVGEVDAPALARLARYHHALALYRAGHFAESGAVFRPLADEDADCPLHRLYLRRIAHYLAEPPPAGWDGVWSIRGK